MPLEPTKLVSRLRFGVGAVIALCLICCAGLGFYAIRFFDIERVAPELPSIAAAYRQTGMPWEAKDLRPNPPLKPDENAAPLLKKCFSTFEVGKINSAVAEAKRLVRERKFELAEHELQPFAKSLEMAARAAEKPRVDWGRDWDLGIRLLLAEYTPVKALAKALAIRAQARAGLGDVDGAVRDLRTIISLGRLCNEEPGIIPMLVHITVDSVGLASTRQCAAILVNNPPALKELAVFTRESNSESDIVNALRGEAYTLVATCRNFRLYGNLSDTVPIDTKLVIRSGFPGSKMEQASLVQVLRFWTRASKVLKRDPKNVRNVMKQLDSLTMPPNSQVTMSNLFIPLLTPVYGQTGDAVAKLQAEGLVTQALLQAMLIHSRTGRFPSSLAEIPGTWIDPFTHRPLYLKSVNGGIRIYSTGPSEVDHGGTAQSEVSSEAKKARAYDIVAAYPPTRVKR